MRKLIFVVAIAIVASITYFQCKSGPVKKTGELAQPGEDISYVFDINFNTGAPPNDLISNATDAQKAAFAWNEFLALHWRASYYNDKKRDNADPTWSYRNPGKYPDLAVWETYAHRSELRPWNNKMLPFDAAPHYSIKTGNQGLHAGLSFALFNNLDENNEIGSCFLYGRTDYFKNRENLVLYQAKSNRDEYEYLLNKYSDSSSVILATEITRNQLSYDSSYYPGGKGQGSCNCPPHYFCLPCGRNADPRNGVPGVRGAMEVKTAWRRLAPDEDPNKFITRTVITYQQLPDKRVYFDNVQYALIGMHIIHKCSSYQNFVYATWEHVDVQKHKMGYVEIFPHGQEGPLTVDYPRLHPILPVSDSSTAYVHRELRKLNPQSALLNYRLVGVQSTPVNDSTTSNYFLANYVIESNPTLARFRGSSIQNPFDNGINNISNGKGIVMGGCQGCHGAGQVKQGTDFSFLMNEFGKPVDTPDIGSHRNKLLIYMQGFEKADRDVAEFLKKKLAEKK
jgi:hypothetical protein